jgi:exopolyphosphatase/guanosine-5'-triphosphate,3'-diphosphate pyrophosphatase
MDRWKGVIFPPGWFFDGQDQIREGILLDLVSRVGEPSFHHLSDIRRQSVLRMADLYHEDLGHIQRATDLSLRLFDATQTLHGLGLRERDLLEAAAMLHNVGLFISHAAHHKHSYYVIRNSDQLNGFTDSEIEVVAQVARYHRKSAPKASHVAFCALSHTEQDVVRVLAGLLRIGISLDRTRQGGIAGLDVTIDHDMVKITLHTDPGLDYSLDLYTANQRSAVLGEALKRGITIELFDSAAS